LVIGVSLGLTAFVADVWSRIGGLVGQINGETHGASCRIMLNTALEEASATYGVEFQRVDADEVD
jgi:hypothetical protein